MPIQKITTKKITKKSSVIKKQPSIKNKTQKDINSLEQTLNNNFKNNKKTIIANPTLVKKENIASKIEKPHNDIFQDEDRRHKKIYVNFFIWTIIVLIIIMGMCIIASYKINFNKLNNSNNNSSSSTLPYSEFSIDKIKKFSSEEEFKTYIQNAPRSANYNNFLTSIQSVSRDEVATMQTMEKAISGQGSAPSPTQQVDRFSQTNTQVLSIDEPDVVKTDGKNIYLSSNQYNIFREMPMMKSISSGAEVSGVSSIMPPQYNNSDIKIIKALPVSDLEVLSKIDKQGEMFLSGNNLMIFSGNKVYNYNVIDKKNPKQNWVMDLEDNNYIIQSRLYNDKLYLIVRSNINEFSSCPIKPLRIGDNQVSIDCTEIYHPDAPISIDSTYVAMKIDPTTGNVEDKISFIGSTSDSIVYMSENNLYISYTYSKDNVKFFYDFISSVGKDIYPAEFIAKISQLINYDISSDAKSVELGNLLAKYYSSLTSDERLKLETEMTNKLSSYYKEHMRDLEQTGIAKISLGKFNVVSAGNIPGRLLNQFSLDEYNNNLRVATTIGENRWFSFGNVNSETVNDVYILNNDLRISGSVKDLGQGERIYSVRFIKNNAYVVTFKQVDPFYVLDLSNATNPKLSGQLKIPGYSSYLHPLTDKLILGIGRENNNVKLSLFDISDPTNPKEVDKYILDEYWSEAMDNHKAFLLDDENKLFFIPGSKGAYIFSYALSDKLSLMKTVSGNSIKRAIYINNYLYIISDDKISVIDEEEFKDVNKLVF